MPRSMLALLIIPLAGWPTSQAQTRMRTSLPTTISLTGPAPTDLTITGTPTTATLIWPAVPGATGYRVYRSPTASATWGLLTQAPIAAIRYDDSGLDHRVQYLYRVAGMLPAGQGAMVERSFQPPSPPIRAWTEPASARVWVNGSTRRSSPVSIRRAGPYPGRSDTVPRARNPR